MNESLLPSRYAKALYRFAVEKNLQTEMYKALQKIVGVFESSEGQVFRETISNPFISENDKRSLILSAAGCKEDNELGIAFNDFLSLLFKNNRIAELRGIVYAYITLYRRENAISKVHVTWASEPEEQSQQRLKEMISKRLENGSMEYSWSVDPNLIGGFKINIDNDQLDASVESELRRLRQQILSK